MLKTILGIALIISGLMNGIRYRWSALKIKEVKTAKGHSRKSMLTAVLDDAIKLLYGIVLLDINLISSASICLVFMVYKSIIIYLYYPYRMRGCANFKRPPIVLYFINSILPNRIRRRL
jgi:fatty acid desaturase